jgi:hypothetical protein
MSESESKFTPKPEKVIMERVELRPGIPVMTPKIVDFSKGSRQLESIQKRMEEEGASTWVDYDGGDFSALEKEGFKHAGQGSYLISPIGEKSWFSDNYIDCTAVVGIGRDATTGKEISFLSHQDPNYFIDGSEEDARRFSQVMTDSLRELVERSEPGTVEVSLLGGIYDPNDKSPDYKHGRYTKSIAKLRQIVHDSLGFDPTVLVGPSNIGSTDIIVETQKRNVWVQRDKQPKAFNDPYQANDLEKTEHKWITSIK